MGQIVIDIPKNIKRRYVVIDNERATVLIDALDASAIRVKNNPAELTRQQMQDLRDGEAATRNLEEMRRSGISYTVDELREKYGLV